MRGRGRGRRGNRTFFPVAHYLPRPIPPLVPPLNKATTDQDPVQRHVAELHCEGVTGPAGRVDHGGGRVVEGAVQRVNGEVGGVDGVEDKDLVDRHAGGAMVRVPQALGERARRRGGWERSAYPLHEWTSAGGWNEMLGTLPIEEHTPTPERKVRLARQTLVQVGEERGEVTFGVARRRDRWERAVLAGDHKPADRVGDDGVDAVAVTEDMEGRREGGRWEEGSVRHAGRRLYSTVP